MAKPPRPWTVTPHGKLEKIDDTLWALEAEVPGMKGLKRRMAIAKLSDSRLVFFNAVPMDDATRAEIDGWGKPSILIVPHRDHMIDAHPMREKFSLDVYCPAREVPLVKERVEVKGTLEDLPKDANYAAEVVQGTKKLDEAVMIVRSADGSRSHLVFCDALMNNPREGAPFLLKLIGSAGGPKNTPLFRLIFGIKDKAAMKAQLERLASTPGLTSLVFSHGTTVTSGAAEAVRKAAAAI